jgi:uncharacterized membrane protein YphA (DoxX/SURF4 family)
MTDTVNLLSWLCQCYLAYLFFCSAYKKVTQFERVSAEFLRWGYPFPRQVTFFLIVVWILSAIAILVPMLAGFAAVVLLAFMAVAFITLLLHGEIRRLVEPARPIALSLFVIAVHSSEMLEIIYQLHKSMS